MKELEKTRQHIQRIGTIIYQASRVGIVIMIILIILQAVLTAAVLASESVAGFVAPRLDNSFLLGARCGEQHAAEDEENKRDHLTTFSRLGAPETVK